MKKRLPALLLLSSFLLVFLGALFKLLHWPHADVTQLVGMLTGVVGVVGLLLVLAKLTR